MDARNKAVHEEAATVSEPNRVVTFSCQSISMLL
jgi:hypothetical protein